MWGELDGISIEVHRFRVSAGAKQQYSPSDVAANCKRLNLQSTPGVCPGLVHPSGRDQWNVKPIMRDRIVGVQLDGPPEFLFSTGPVPVVAAHYPSKPSMGLGKGIIDLKSLPNRPP